MSLKPKAFAEFQALRHYEKERASDLTGTNHGILRLRHPKHGTLAIGCLCGEVFWSSRLVRNEMPTPDAYGDHRHYVLSFRAWMGVRAMDVSEAKARKVRGVGKQREKRGGWF